MPYVNEYDEQLSQDNHTGHLWYHDIVTRLEPAYFTNRGNHGLRCCARRGVPHTADGGRMLLLSGLGELEGAKSLDVMCETGLGRSSQSRAEDLTCRTDQAGGDGPGALAF